MGCAPWPQSGFTEKGGVMVLGPLTWPHSWLSRGLARIQPHLAGGQAVVPRPAEEPKRSCQALHSLGSWSELSPAGQVWDFTLWG